MATFEAFELALRSNFVVFTKVGPDEIHVSTWYGYDVECVVVMSRANARREWRRLQKDGYTLEREARVSEAYLGIDKKALNKK